MVKRFEELKLRVALHDEEQRFFALTAQMRNLLVDIRLVDPHGHTVCA